MSCNLVLRSKMPNSCKIIATDENSTQVFCNISPYMYFLYFVSDFELLQKHALAPVWFVVRVVPMYIHKKSNNFSCSVVSVCAINKSLLHSFWLWYFDCKYVFDLQCTDCRTHLVACFVSRALFFEPFQPSMKSSTVVCITSHAANKIPCELQWQLSYY